MDLELNEPDKVGPAADRGARARDEWGPAADEGDPAANHGKGGVAADHGESGFLNRGKGGPVTDPKDHKREEGDLAADQGDPACDQGVPATDDRDSEAGEATNQKDPAGNLATNEGNPAADEGHPAPGSDKPILEPPLIEDYSLRIAPALLFLKRLIHIWSDSDIKTVPRFMKTFAGLLVSNYVVWLIGTFVGVKSVLLWLGMIFLIVIFKWSSFIKWFTRKNKFYRRNNEPPFNTSTAVDCTNVIVWCSVPLLYVFKLLLESDVRISSVWCSSLQHQLRTCHFSNLYYDTHRGFLFLLDESSVVSGINNFQEFKNLKLSPVADHNGVNMELTMVRSVASLSMFSESLFFEFNKFIKEPHFLLYRFKPDNFMHVVHDDLIPLFFKFRELSMGSVSSIVSSTNLFFIDMNDDGPFAEWYHALSSSAPLLAKDMSPRKLYCFSSLYLGLSNTSFFQYGFGKPQGPIGPNLNGREIGEFKRYYLNYFGVEPDRAENELKVTLISRKINRKIINEEKISSTLSTLANEDSFYVNKVFKMAKGDMIANKNEMLNLVASSDIVVGMHGAETILSLFLPDSSVFIELFPFGISRENVSPIHSLSKVERVHFRYLSWNNLNEGNSVVHPEYAKEFGGTKEFSEELKQKIFDAKQVPAVTCCNNPSYLFRMYQDTMIDDSFTGVASAALKLLKFKTPIATTESQWFFPGPVSNLDCNCHLNHVDVSWTAPHNVEHLQTKYDVLVTADSVQRNVFTNKSLLRFDFGEGFRTVQVWVSSVVSGKKSTDSYCTCEFVKPHR